MDSHRHRVKSDGKHMLIPFRNRRNLTFTTGFMSRKNARLLKNNSLTEDVNTGVTAYNNSLTETLSSCS